MSKCKYCEDFNKEKEEMKIYELEVGYQEFYFYECLIKYCPACGTILDKYKK